MSHRQRTAFVKYPSRLASTLLACWEEGYKEPWFILTEFSLVDANENCPSLPTQGTRTI